MLNYRKNLKSAWALRSWGSGGGGERTRMLYFSLNIFIFVRKKSMLIHENIKVTFVVSASLSAHKLPLLS